MVKYSQVANAIYLSRQVAGGLANCQHRKIDHLDGACNVGLLQCGPFCIQASSLALVPEDGVFGASCYFDEKNSASFKALLKLLCTLGTIMHKLLWFW